MCDKPIFVTGADRSGTSLMFALLASHPNISMVRRTNMWRWFYMKYGDLSVPENFERCLTDLLNYTRMAHLRPDPERIRQEFWQGESTYGHLFALFNEMVKCKKIHLRYGARTPEDIIYKDQIKEWATKPGVNVRLTVDKGDDTWKGNVGVVTTILEPNHIDIKNSVAVVCGPPIMMKFSTLKLLDLGYKPEQIYLSMEKNMSCGVGKCGHCRLDTFYCCTDGPVFTYDKIKDAHEIWD